MLYSLTLFVVVLACPTTPLRCLETRAPCRWDFSRSCVFRGERQGDTLFFASKEKLPTYFSCSFVRAKDTPFRAPLVERRSCFPTPLLRFAPSCYGCAVACRFAPIIRFASCMRLRLSCASLLFNASLSFFGFAVLVASLCIFGFALFVASLLYSASPCLSLRSVFGFAVVVASLRCAASPLLSLRSVCAASPRFSLRSSLCT